MEISFFLFQDSDVARHSGSLKDEWRTWVRKRVACSIEMGCFKKYPKFSWKYAKGETVGDSGYEMILRGKWEIFAGMSLI